MLSNLWYIYYWYQKLQFLKSSGHQGRNQTNPQWPQVSVPLMSQPVAGYRKGGTTPLYRRPDRLILSWYWPFRPFTFFFEWPHVLGYAGYLRVMWSDCLAYIFSSIPCIRDISHNNYMTVNESFKLVKYLIVDLINTRIVSVMGYGRW